MSISSLSIFPYCSQNIGCLQAILQSCLVPTFCGASSRQPVLPVSVPVCPRPARALVLFVPSPCSCPRPVRALVLFVPSSCSCPRPVRCTLSLNSCSGVTHCAAMGRINSFTQFLVANTLELFPSGAVHTPAASAVAAADPPSAPVEAASAADE